MTCLTGIRLCGTLCCALAVSTVGQASSPDAWKKLSNSILKKCTERLNQTVKKASNPTYYLDPTAGQEIVPAFLRYEFGPSKSLVSVVCLFDKKSQAILEFVELNGFADAAQWRPVPRF